MVFTFLDVAVGIFLAIFASWFWGAGLNQRLIAPAVLFALLPDVDFWIEFFKHGSVGGKEIREHREILHFPLAYVPIIFIVALVFGAMWAFLFGCGIFLHFLHDSVGLGWGIKWLWPLSHRSYKFFSERDGRFSSRLVVSWRPRELKWFVANYGDPNWFRNIYLRPHPISILETLSLFAAIIALYFRLS